MSKKNIIVIRKEVYVYSDRVEICDFPKTIETEEILLGRFVLEYSNTLPNVLNLRYGDFTIIKGCEHCIHYISENKCDSTNLGNLPEFPFINSIRCYEPLNKVERLKYKYYINLNKRVSEIESEIIRQKEYIKRNYSDLEYNTPIVYVSKRVMKEILETNTLPETIDELVKRGILK